MKKQYKPISEFENIEAIQVRDGNGFYTKWSNANYFEQAALKALFNATKQPHEVPNLRAIHCKFLPMTNTKPARLKIYEEPTTNGQGKQSKVFSLNMAEPGQNVAEVGYKRLKKAGFNIISRYSTQDEIVYLCNNWGNEYINIKDMEA